MKILKSFTEFLFEELNIGRRPNQRIKSVFNTTDLSGKFVGKKNGGFGYVYR